MIYLYILHSVPTGRFYIGITDDPPRRLAEHNAGHTPSTRGYRPWDMVYLEAFPTRSAAVRRERQLKRWKSREALLTLMAQR